ncbi:hypothetical protein SAMN05216501_0206 [Pseudomonas putida]|nr:hypothetical protein SAMN05216501_0206 [Pseudomonas putida]
MGLRISEGNTAPVGAGLPANTGEAGARPRCQRLQGICDSPSGNDQ